MLVASHKYTNGAAISNTNTGQGQHKQKVSAPPHLSEL